MLANAAQSSNASPWHAVVRCVGCAAPLPVAEPFEAISCGSCGHRQSLRGDTIARLRHHFAAVERYRRVATEARWEHEDMTGPPPSERRGRFSRAFFAVVGLIAAAATILSSLFQDYATVVLFAVFLVIGPAQFVVWKFELWNLARHRAAAGPEAIPFSELGWASCANCGGKVRIGEAIPTCRFCSAELVASAGAKAVARSAAKEHAEQRVEQALDVRSELIARERAAALSGAKTHIGFVTLYGTFIGGGVAFGALEHFSVFPSWLAFAVALAVALPLGALYFRVTVTRHRREVDARQNEQLNTGRPIELQRELERLHARD